MESGIPLKDVSWVLGSHAEDWQKLAAAIGSEKALEYQNKFIPIWKENVNETEKTLEADSIRNSDGFGDGLDSALSAL
jgi:hypothetical protein